MKRLSLISTQMAGRPLSTFPAACFDKVGGAQTFGIRQLQLEDLPDEDVLVRIEYSTVNYKDALAITNSGPIVKTYPMVGGVDYAGTVVESRDAGFRPGDAVVMNGWGAGEVHWGGYSQYMRVKGAHLLPLPAPFTLRTAMAVGTAGYTAMLCALRLEDLGVRPAAGPVAITGASGGVGSFAVALLSSLGYTVAAVTGRPADQGPYLRALGAVDVVDRATLTGTPKALAKQIYAGAVDTVGGVVLANLLPSMQYGGVVTACGLAAGPAFAATVMPFILRNVTLAGVDSVMAPQPLRQRAWAALARTLDPAKLAAIAPPDHTVGLDGLEAAARDIVAGRHTGRVVVDVNR